MLKKTGLVLAAASVIGLTASNLNAADYKRSGCAKAAKLEFPSDPAARKDFKHWCKDQWKVYKAGHS